MFRCHFCKDVTDPRTPAKVVVIRQRHKVYERRPEVFRQTFLFNGKKKAKWVDDPGGVGVEIVCEVQACPSCARKRGV